MSEQKVSIKKNLGYQTLYQIVISTLPLITAPYLARILGATQQGIYSFTSSIVSYFTLFAMLGFSNHGTRAIAEAGNDEEKRSVDFTCIFILKLITSSIAVICYVFYLLAVPNENYTIAGIQILSIIACIFDINWLFFGLEKFKTTVTRNLIVYLSVFALTLTLVKKQEDLWIYTVLMSASVLLGNISLWFRMSRYVSFKKVHIEDLKKHIKPVLILFVPLLALSVYHVMDKTMLGLLSTYENSGYYFNADKVINIPIGIINGISTVMFPRMVSVIKTRSHDDYEALFSKCVEGIILVSSAMAFGIAAISKEFTPLFFGAGFDPCIQLIIVLAPVMIIKSVSTAIRYQYLVPNKQEKYFMYSVFIGAVANLIANWILIPLYGALGAVIGTLIAELVACLVQIFFVQREINFVRIIGRSIPYICMALVMYIGVRFFASFFEIGNFTKVVLEIICGVIIFGIEALVFYCIRKDKTVISEFIQVTASMLSKGKRH